MQREAQTVRPRLTRRMRKWILRQNRNTAGALVPREFLKRLEALERGEIIFPFDAKAR